MRYLSFSLCLCCVLTVSASADDTKADGKAAAEKKVIKTKDVKVRDLTLRVPVTWKKEKSSSSMRLATYSTPTVEGDKDRGELTVFNFGGGGGGVGDNIQRWIGQFNSAGKTVSVKKGKAGENDYYLANITGTYNKSVGPPFLRKTEPAENYRMLAAIVVLEGKGSYFIKLTGPKKSIKAQEELFRNSFDGDSKTEKEYEL